MENLTAFYNLCPPVFWSLGLLGFVYALKNTLVRYTLGFGLCLAIGTVLPGVAITLAGAWIVAVVLNSI